MDYLFNFEISGKKYRARVPLSLEHYVLERFNGYAYEKVRCFTDAEERRFPKAAAYVSTAYLHGLRKQTETQNND